MRKTASCHDPGAGGCGFAGGGEEAEEVDGPTGVLVGMCVNGGEDAEEALELRVLRGIQYSGAFVFFMCFLLST